MKTIFYLGLLSTILCSCEKSSEIVEPPAVRNLIANSSFEVLGDSSLWGWQVLTNFGYSSVFSNDVPQSGGAWSVMPVRSDTHFTVLRTSVAALQGTHTYNISVWGKSIGNHGHLVVAFHKALVKLILISDSTWTNYQSTFTFTVSGQDNILTIELEPSPLCVISKSYFDLCKLEVLD
jgi:hypothetical protein